MPGAFAVLSGPAQARRIVTVRQGRKWLPRTAACAAAAVVVSIACSASGAGTVRLHRATSTTASANLLPKKVCEIAVGLDLTHAADLLSAALRDSKALEWVGM